MDVIIAMLVQGKTDDVCRKKIHWALHRNHTWPKKTMNYKCIWRYWGILDILALFLYFCNIICCWALSGPKGFVLVETHMHNIITTKASFMFNLYYFFDVYFAQAFLLDLLSTWLTNCMWEVLPYAGTSHFQLHRLNRLLHRQYF